MAFTPIIPDAQQVASGAVLSIKITTAQAGTSPVTIPAAAIQSPSVELDQISSGVADAEAGYPHAATLAVSFMYKAVSQAAGVTLLNEMTLSEKTAYIQVTYLSGETLTFSSGVDDTPIIYWKYKLISGDNQEAVMFEVTGNKIIAAQNITIT